jgi:response regulator RpfG family c-di-GMP phosphodiesterase
VDDDTNLLEGLKRVLHASFAVTVTSRGADALQLLATNGPFAVVVSDMRMPEMDGVEVLSRAKEIAPYTVRVLLTGQADLKDAASAVNDGNIFRFIAKPCSPSTLIQALNASVAQYRLQISERILLERTLRGSIGTLIEILSLAHPEAFGRAERARTAVLKLATSMEIGDHWILEIAAMLSQIGCVTLPAATASKLYEGSDLTAEESAMVQNMPAVAAELLTSIPRLEEITEIVRLQQKSFDGSGPPDVSPRGEAIPWGARALKIVVDYDGLETRGLAPQIALQLMHSRHGWYDTTILRAFTALHGGTMPGLQCEELALTDVLPGMVFVEDVRTPGGTLLIARGQRVTPGLASRVRNLGPDSLPHHPVKMVVEAS